MSPAITNLRWLGLILFVACGPQYVSRSQPVPAQGSQSRIIAHSRDLRRLDARTYFHWPLMSRLGALGITGTVYYDDTRIVIDTPERDPGKLARAVRALSRAGYYELRDHERARVNNSQVRIAGIIPTTPECACIAHWIVEVKQPAPLLRGGLVVALSGQQVDIPRVSFLAGYGDAYQLDVQLDPAHAPALDELLLAFSGPIPSLRDAALHPATDAAPGVTP